MKLKPVCFVIAMSMTAVGLLFSQAGGSVASQKGRVERVKVHGKSLEGNLAGDSPDRDVSIYLPPLYDTNRSQRFPVVYLLHGYTNSDERNVSTSLRHRPRPFSEQPRRGPG